MPCPDHIEQRLAAVKVVIFDVDGVLTDGSLWIGSAPTRRWNVKDGFGFFLARRTDLVLALCSGNDHPDIRQRAERLRLDVLRLGRLDKGEAVREILAELGLERGQALFVGDDLFDLPGMRAAGLGACPADAATEVRERSDWLLSSEGGRGAAREVLEALLRARGDWERVTAEFLATDTRGEDACDEDGGGDG